MSEMVWWRDMEIAPKDRRILIATKDGFVVIAEWWRDRWVDPEDEYIRYMPVCWMPLPEPPKS